MTMYIGGNEQQFIISENEDFVVRYTSPSFVYYKQEPKAANAFYTDEKRIEKIASVICNDNYCLERKNDFIHCILCVKWYPLDNAMKYCYDCPYNMQRKEKIYLAQEINSN